MGKGIAISMVVMIVLLVLAVGYIGYDKYSEWRAEKDQVIYQQWAQLGYEQGLTQMFQQAGSCQQVPLTVENKTINIIAVGCPGTEVLMQQAAE